MKDGTNAPGLILMGLSVGVLVGAIAAFATAATTAGVVTAVLAAVLFAAGGVWVLVAHRRVRERELRWLAEHPEADAQPPAS